MSAVIISIILYVQIDYFTIFHPYLQILRLIIGFAILYYGVTTSVNMYKGWNDNATSGFGLLLSGMIEDKVRSWYCNRMAAKFALIKCVNEFIRDYNNGFFNQ